MGSKTNVSSDGRYGIINLLSSRSLLYGVVCCYGVLWCGMVRYSGIVWYGMKWHRSVCSGMVWHGILYYNAA